MLALALIVVIVAGAGVFIVCPPERGGLVGPGVAACAAVGLLLQRVF